MTVIVTVHDRSTGARLLYERVIGAEGCIDALLGVLHALPSNHQANMTGIAATTLIIDETRALKPYDGEAAA
jgi:hypothetical protein